MKYGWDDIALLGVNGYDVQLMEAFELEIPHMEAVIDKWHGAGNVSPTTEHTGTNMPAGDVVMKMPLNDATDASQDVFFGTGTHITDGVFFAGLETNALGKRIEACNVHQVSMRKEPAQDGVTKLAAMLKPAGEIHTLRLVMARATVTADGDTTGASLDNSALSSNGGYGLIVVKDADYDGGTGLDGKLQHSVDDAVWVDLVSFTSITTARGAEIVSVAAGTTVNRYLGFVYDLTGTPGGSATATVLSAFRRK